MKALVISSINDFRLFSLVSPLKQIMEVGFTPRYDKESVEKFAPDIVFSDCGIGWDSKKIDKIKPFINLDTFQPKQNTPKYECDIAYLGPESDMSLLEFHKMGYNVRIFSSTPCSCPIYSGSVPVEECWHIYRSAKVCPIPADDLGYREMDIIAAGGKGVKFRHKHQFFTDIVDAINGKTTSTYLTKQQVFNNHTNYDRLSSVLEDLGFKAISYKIMEKKNDRCPRF